MMKTKGLYEGHITLFSTVSKVWHAWMWLILAICPFSLPRALWVVFYLGFVLSYFYVTNLHWILLQIITFVTSLFHKNKFAVSLVVFVFSHWLFIIVILCSLEMEKNLTYYYSWLNCWWLDKFHKLVFFFFTNIFCCHGQHATSSWSEFTSFRFKSWSHSAEILPHFAWGAQSRICCIISIII